MFHTVTVASQQSFSLTVRDDHSVATVPLEVVTRPVHEHYDRIAEPDQEYQMQPEPAEPTERPVGYQNSITTPTSGFLLA